MDNYEDVFPDPIDTQEEIVNRCIIKSALYYDINPHLIKAVAKVEAGKPGTISKNKNGTYDLGVMQLNTTNFKLLKKNFAQVELSDIIYSPCINIALGTWFLKKQIDNANDYWTGVGNYHSKTQKYHNRYLKKVIREYQKLVKLAKK